MYLSLPWTLSTSQQFLSGTSLWIIAKTWFCRFHLSDFGVPDKAKWSTYRQHRGERDPSDVREASKLIPKPGIVGVTSTPRPPIFTAPNIRKSRYFIPLSFSSNWPWTWHSWTQRKHSCSKLLPGCLSAAELIDSRFLFSWQLCSIRWA